MTREEKAVERFLQSVEDCKKVARKVLETVDAGLVAGLGRPVPGKMCALGAMKYALGEPHGDYPSCVGSSVRAYTIQLNDAEWPTNKDRAKGMRKLVVASLGSKEVDQRAFREYIVVETVKQIVPIALRAAAKQNPLYAEELERAAASCEAATDLYSALVAANAAHRKTMMAIDNATAIACATAYAAFYNAAYDAARAAVLAASLTDSSEELLKVLRLSAKIGLNALIKLNSPGVKWLDLCE